MLVSVEDFITLDIFCGFLFQKVMRRLIIFIAAMASFAMSLSAAYRH